MPGLQIVNLGLREIKSELLKQNNNQNSRFVGLNLVLVVLPHLFSKMAPNISEGNKTLLLDSSTLRQVRFLRLVLFIYSLSLEENLNILPSLNLGNSTSITD